MLNIRDILKYLVELGPLSGGLSSHLVPPHDNLNGFSFNYILHIQNIKNSISITIMVAGMQIESSEISTAIEVH